MSEEVTPPCCPDFPACDHAVVIPNVVPITTALKTGTSILPDGSPAVIIMDLIQGQAATLSPIDAAKLGVRLIRLSEQAITTALLYESMVSRGMPAPEAHAFVQAFKDEQGRVIRGEKTSFQGPPGT